MKVQQKRRHFTVDDFDDDKVECGKTRMIVKGFDKPLFFDEVDEGGKLVCWFNEADGEIFRIHPRKVRKILPPEEPSEDSDDAKAIDTSGDEADRTNGKPKTSSKNKKSKTDYIPGSWWPHHKSLCLAITWQEATLWAYVNHKLERLKRKGKLHQPFKKSKDGKRRPRKGDWVYVTRAMIEEDVGIPRRAQDRLIKSLKKKRLLDTTKFSNDGGRQKRYFRLFTKSLLNRIRKAKERRSSQPRTK